MGPGVKPKPNGLHFGQWGGRQSKKNNILDKRTGAGPTSDPQRRIATKNRRDRTLRRGRGPVGNRGGKGLPTIKQEKSAAGIIAAMKG